MSARKIPSGSESAAIRSASKRPAALPGQHDGEDADRHRQREPAAVRDLGRAGDEERQVEAEEHRQQRAGAQRAPLPEIAGHVEEQHRRDGHRAGHRDAVGVGQRARLAEAEHQRHAGHHQQPVHLGDVDLPLGLAGGVDDGDARQVAELNRLAGERVGARDERLRRHHGRQGRQDHHRVEPGARHQAVERIGRRLGALEQQRPLPEVVDEQRREHAAVPGEADGARPEVPHVGVQRLAAGHAEDDRAEHQEPVPAVHR